MSKMKPERFVSLLIDHNFYLTNGEKLFLLYQTPESGLYLEQLSDELKTIVKTAYNNEIKLGNYFDKNGVPTNYKEVKL